MHPQHHVQRLLSLGLWIALGVFMSGFSSPKATHAQTSTSSPSRSNQPASQAKTGRIDTPKASTKPAQPSAFTRPKKLPHRSRKKPPGSSKKKNALWNRDLGLGGFAGSWGSMPLLGLRGAIPLSPFLAMRLSFALCFATQRQPVLSYTNLSVGFLVRLPSLIPPIRTYAVTRLDFWPLWNVLQTKPEIIKISEKPTFGLSILMGMEIFLVNSLAFVLEAGFSSGMIIGIDTIRVQFEAFGFVIQSGLQMYF